MIVLALMRYAGEESESELVALTTSGRVADHWASREDGNTAETMVLNSSDWPRRGAWNLEMRRLMEAAENDRIATTGPRGEWGQ